MTINKTKICYVITKGVWGGAQKYLYSLAIGLPKDQYEVVVMTGEGNILKQKLEERGIKTYVIGSLKRDVSIIAEIKSFFELMKIVWRESPDVLHLNSPKASGLGAVAGRLCFVPKIIQTVHGFTWNEDRKMASKVSISFFSWLTVMLCHKTIVIASKEEKQVKVLPFVRDSKIVLIRNGVEKIDFKEKSTAQKEILELCSRRNLEHTNMSTWQVDMFRNVLWLGTISELHKNKGLEYAIEAVSKITSPFLFFIVGEGEERKNLENIVRKYGLENKVFLVGFIEGANKYLKAFDIFLLSSIKEGLPYVLLEAGQTSLPVIASSVGGIPDIIENGISGILTTKARPGEMTRAIEYLIKNPEKQKLFGKNLHDKVEKDFSIELMIEKTKKLY